MIKQRSERETKVSDSVFIVFETERVVNYSQVFFRGAIPVEVSVGIISHMTCI